MWIQFHQGVNCCKVADVESWKWLADEMWAQTTPSQLQFQSIYISKLCTIQSHSLEAYSYGANRAAHMRISSIQNPTKSLHLVLMTKDTMIAHHLIGRTFLPTAEGNFWWKRLHPVPPLREFYSAFNAQYDESLHDAKLANDLPSNILVPISSMPCGISPS